LTFTLREEHKLRVMDKRVLMKRGKVTGYWNNEELHDGCAPPIVTTRIKARKIRWVVHVECMSEKRNSNVSLIRKPERNGFVL
jgi:hypothetical protein